MKVSTKVDLSGLKKLQKQLKSTSVDVGYIDSKNHWMNPNIPVATVAAHLHYWSPWKDTFMLSEDKINQVQKIVTSELAFFGLKSMTQIAKEVGKKAAYQIEVNINNVQSPPNSKEWESYKGFNKPLVFGSREGFEPNLVSEL